LGFSNNLKNREISSFLEVGEETPFKH
jgi:hypothetical protein